MIAVEDAVRTIARDGFVVVPDFFDRALVEKARREILALYAEAQTPAVPGSPRPRSMPSPKSHLLIDLPGFSPALDQLMETVLTDPQSLALLSRVAGPGFRLRDINCRRMTGLHDVGDQLNPPHEWHRDSPGEFCIGLFLTDVPPGGNGGTALVPGSHLFPANPRYDVLLGRPFYSRRPSWEGIGALTRLNPFSRRLARRFLGSATGAHGKQGDFYIFVNDTWHGREVNLHGAQAMVILAGGFAPGFSHQEGWRPPSPELLERIPPTFRHRLIGDAAAAAPAAQEPTVIDTMLRTRPVAKFPDPFWLARAERRIANVTSLVLELPLMPIRLIARNQRLRAFARPWVKRLGLR